jgi:hypothetical protein
MLENTWREIQYRLDILRATNGAHIEVYWTWWVVLSSKANQLSVSLILCVLCVLEIWWIIYGHSCFWLWKSLVKISVYPDRYFAFLSLFRSRSLPHNSSLNHHL